MTDDPKEESLSSIKPTTDSSQSSTVRNDDLAHDGMWPFTGFGGMMIKLAEDFVKSRQETAEAEPRNSDYDNEDIFVALDDFDPYDEAAVFRFQERLDERGLKMADGVLRRLVEGCCPPRIRIRRLDEDTTMVQLLALKQEGNTHFAEKGYKEAIDCYDAALETIPSNQRGELHVSPNQQLTELVHTLSNKAECLLRKFRYEEAAEASTDALIFDGGHEKSRLRRARAGLEIGKYDRAEATSRGDVTMTGVAYLVQAAYDLDEILSNPYSTHGGRDAADTLLIEINELLDRAKKKVLSKDLDAEWNMTVLKIQSRCW